MSLKKLEGLINTLSSYVDKKDVINEKVSKGSLGWHVEHSLITISKIVDAVTHSNPAEFKSKFSFLKTLVFTINKIPRGKAKAPKTVWPSDVITIESLKNLTAKALQKITQLNELNKKSYFPHPYFGNLNLADTVKFLNIHTQHHLNIVNDILVK